jgi:pimeloyl-ACP methyl ester carboxylesterase
MTTLRLKRSTIGLTDVGSGPAVVLLHGSASSRHQWRKLATQLSDRYRVLVPDLHGYGETILHDTAPPRLSDELGIVRGLADHIGEPFHLVGHSFGGAIALGAARLVHEQLASLTLFEPAAFHFLRDAGDTEAWSEIDDIAQQHMGYAWERKLEACADVMMGYWIGIPAWKAMPQEKRAAIIATMPKVAFEWRWITLIEDSLARYARIDAPTLLLRGAHTRVPPRRVIDLLRNTLPNCRVEEIQGAGHMAPLTHPEIVNAVIQAHIDRHPAAATKAEAA